MSGKDKNGLDELKKKLGKDLDIHVFNSNDPNNLKSYYSPTRFPKLKIKRNSVEYEVNVNLYSSEEEDKKLLHQLLVSTREQN